MAIYRQKTESRHYAKIKMDQRSNIKNNLLEDKTGKTPENRCRQGFCEQNPSYPRNNTKN